MKRGCKGRREGGKETGSVLRLWTISGGLLGLLCEGNYPLTCCFSSLLSFLCLRFLPGWLTAGAPEHRRRRRRSQRERGSEENCETKSEKEGGRERREWKTLQRGEEEREGKERRTTARESQVGSAGREEERESDCGREREAPQTHTGQLTDLRSGESGGAGRPEVERSDGRLTELQPKHTVPLTPQTTVPSPSPHWESWEDWWRGEATMSDQNVVKEGWVQKRGEDAPCFQIPAGCLVFCFFTEVAEDEAIQLHVDQKLLNTHLLFLHYQNTHTPSCSRKCGLIRCWK